MAEIYQLPTAAPTKIENRRQRGPYTAAVRKTVVPQHRLLNARAHRADSGMATAPSQMPATPKKPSSQVLLDILRRDLLRAIERLNYALGEIDQLQESG